jgi:hypothetical protein
MPFKRIVNLHIKRKSICDLIPRYWNSLTPEAGMKIGSIVTHCREFNRMVEYWLEALHYISRAPAKDGWVVLCDPENKGPNLSFQTRESRAPHRSWIHLDLYLPVRDEEVARLVALGARRYPWKYRPHAEFCRFGTSVER